MAPKLSSSADDKRFWPSAPDPARRDTWHQKIVFRIYAGYEGDRRKSYTCQCATPSHKSGYRHHLAHQGHRGGGPGHGRHSLPIYPDPKINLILKQIDP